METNIKKKATDTLLDKGVYITVRPKGILSVFKKTLRFTIYPSTLGTLYTICGIYLKSEIDVTKLESNPVGYANEKAVNAAKDYAKIIAVAVLNSKWKIRLFANILSKRFLWWITPKDLLSIMVLVIEANNILDFMNSIRLTSGIAKMADPKKENLSPLEQGG